MHEQDMTATVTCSLQPAQPETCAACTCWVPPPQASSLSLEEGPLSHTTLYYNNEVKGNSPLLRLSTPCSHPPGLRSISCTGNKKRARRTTKHRR